MNRELDVRPEVAPPVDLFSCDEEPIQVPGAIQRFGFLVAMDHQGRVFRVSENLDEFLPLAPARALGQSVESVLGEEVGFRCRAFLVAQRRPPDDDPLPIFDAQLPGTRNLFTLSLASSPGGLIIECEPCSRDPAAYINMLRRITESCDRLRQTRTSLDLVQTAARIFANRTRYHYTLVYRFDGKMNGEVIAEVVNGVEPRWLGHHFPHTDIPLQARALYLRNLIRMIADVEYQPSPLLGLSDEALEPLDLSDTMLRSVSPIHLEYLRNMGVRATLTLSLIVEDRLWGLIVCHHHQPHYPPRSLRLFCDQMAQFLSLELQNLLAWEHRQASEGLKRQVDGIMARLRASEDMGAALRDSPELLSAWEADTFEIVLHGERTLLGRHLPPDLTGAIAAGLRQANAGQDPGQACALDRIAPLLVERDLPPDGVAGALFLPLGDGGEDYLLWLRPEQIQRIKWAGEAAKDTAEAGTQLPARLTPRASFATWITEVRGASLAWTPAQREAAGYLGQVIRNQLATEVKLSREREALSRRMALFDVLTGLPNRVLLMDRMQVAIARVQRQRGALAVCFIDLDRFKPVNDRYGHDEGDAVLRLVAERLVRQLRQCDTLARIGGDEFVALIEDIGGQGEDRVMANAAAVAGKLIQALNEPLGVEDRRHQVGASIGIACCPALGTDPRELLRAADLAMYLAKQGGANPAFALPEIPLQTPLP